MAIIGSETDVLADCLERPVVRAETGITDATATGWEEAAGATSPATTDDTIAEAAGVAETAGEEATCSSAMGNACPVGIAGN